MLPRPPKYDPSRIESPVALLAAVVLCGVALVGTLIFGAAVTGGWVSAVLAMGGLCLAVGLLVGVFVLFVFFRSSMLGDWAYLALEFRAFKPQLVQSWSSDVPGSAGAADLEAERVRRYEQQRGLFLCHVWRPSRTQGQVADIRIFLQQHASGPLRRNEVESVEYQLGPKFSPSTITTTNAKESFRLDVSAYGPMLCIAKVHFRDGQEPLVLDRYIDFYVPSNEVVGLDYW